MSSTLHGTTVLLAGPTTELTQALAASLAAAGAAVRLPSPDSRGADAHVSAVYAELGRIDVLVNVIDSAPSMAFSDMSPADWNRLLSVTLADAFAWSQAIARTMSLAGEHGTIINLACDLDMQEAEEFTFSRQMRREGVVAFTKALAAELSDRQIRVNAIVSGPILQINEPFGNVVRATQFLCAARKSFVSGQTIDLGVGHQGY